jgi:hypothetical protein
MGYIIRDITMLIYNIDHIVKDSRKAGRIAIACILPNCLQYAKNDNRTTKKSNDPMEIRINIDRDLIKNRTEYAQFTRHQTNHQKQNP